MFRISFPVTADEKAALEKAAKEDDRTLSMFVRRQLDLPGLIKVEVESGD